MPFVVALPEGGDRELDAMEKVTAAARGERSFPNPIDVNTGDAGEDEQDENEKETLQTVECKGRRGGVSNDQGGGENAQRDRSEDGELRMVNGEGGKKTPNATEARMEN
jgi:hypothetical protein